MKQKKRLRPEFVIERPVKKGSRPKLKKQKKSEPKAVEVSKPKVKHGVDFRTPPDQQPDSSHLSNQQVMANHLGAYPRGGLVASNPGFMQFGNPMFGGGFPPLGVQGPRGGFYGGGVHPPQFQDVTRLALRTPGPVPAAANVNPLLPMGLAGHHHPLANQSLQNVNPRLLEAARGRAEESRKRQLIMDALSLAPKAPGPARPDP